MNRSRSIQTFLLLGILATFLASWVFNASLIYFESQEQVEELFDAELAQHTRTLQAVMTPYLSRGESLNYQVEGHIDRQNDDEDDDEEYRSWGHNYERKLAIQIWSFEGKLILTNHLKVPNNFDRVREGYQNLERGDSDWRSFTLKDNINQIWIRVSQQTDVRTELTEEIAEEAILPSLLFIPVILVVSAVVIRLGLSPLRTISKELKERDYANLSPLDQTKAPTELKPMLIELNDLFKRVSESHERERRFTSDAAHELRTPLSVAKIHLQNVIQITQDSTMQAYVEKSLKGIERLIHLVKQLLLLSRIESEENPKQLININLTGLVKDMLEELSTQEAYGHLQFKLDIQEDHWIESDDTALSILIRNLLDNACRYASENVHLILENRELTIFNSCELIPEKELPFIFERFKRGSSTKVEGSGLGLAICQEICDRLGYIIRIENQTQPQGVKVTLTF